MNIESKSNNYRKAICLIAINENPSDVNVENISEYMSVFVVSQLFNTEIETITEEIVKIRSYMRNAKKISHNEKIVVA